MADVVYLSAGEEMPDHGDDEAWLIIEATTDGHFFGTGSSWKASGEWVGYRSLAEDDTSLETALDAAQLWAAKYNVVTIWVSLKSQIDSH
jgi:hypothetical protein